MRSDPKMLSMQLRILEKETSNFPPNLENLRLFPLPFFLLRSRQAKIEEKVTRSVEHGFSRAGA